MKKKKTNLTTLDAFVDKHHGKRGSKKREEFEAGYEVFKLGSLLQEVRLARGLTQEELGARVGKNKSYISKIENDIKEIRLSTLQEIVEIGLGGKIRLSIYFN
ncbi:helix-turn-helix domain-containing protein [Chitinophaga sp. Cy-1792]|uniref:helix-turn-helix domain-containing protein n=1 Tax=Chitinophaga sp. Cy-1792 TaxID=2608339 RepID=UPI00141D7DBE|nr:helix-turn-helix transcriptional regulator [Chitinophaga sp. Cy-1792]NIG53889.1 helix-turn-helix transcriptional regulator [Chitinophaga sp. Cy-1792]